MYRCLLSDFFEKDMKIVMDAYMFVNKRKRERCSARMSEHPFFL
ncbi:homocysteine methyltransferase [Bacillus inaquosorum]|nr:homocysteine methyltransferase [Bacillus inaquosorum]